MTNQESSTVNVQEKSTTNVNIVEVNAAYKTYYKKTVYYKRVYSKGKYRYVKAYRYVKSYKYVKASSTTSTKTYSTYRSSYYKKVVYYKRVYSKGKYRYVKAYRYVKSYKYVKASSTTYSGVASVSDNSTEATILRGAARYGYSGAAHDGATMEKIGAGDCWAMSDYLQTKLTKAGIRSRVVQYANSYTSRHRSVQLYQNGKWLDVPYKKYGINQLFSAQSSKPSLKVIAGG